MHQPSLTLVIPALNESESLPQAIKTCSDLASLLQPGSLEVIFVDDGSSDETPIVLKSAADSHPWLRVITHEQNRGYGAALRSGFEAASTDFVAYTDADSQFDLLEFADHLPLTTRADLVAGFRVYRFDPLPRLVVSWVYNRIVRILFRVPVRDVDCSFKIMRRDKLDNLVLMCDDFFIDTELMARARKWNWQITEVGVRHYPRVAGKTTVVVGDIPRTLRRLGQMWVAIHFPSRRDHAARLLDQQERRRIARGS